MAARRQALRRRRVARSVIAWGVGVSAIGGFGLVLTQADGTHRLTAGRGITVLAEAEAGRGVAAGPGDTVTVAYRVRLEDGAEIPQLDLFAAGRTHTFTVNDNTVIAGLNDGVVGMRAGGVREFRVPPDLHYGRDGHAGIIPPKTALVFRVEMVSVRDRNDPRYADVPVH